MGLTFKLKVDIIETKTASPRSKRMRKFNSHTFLKSDHVLKNADQQQMLFNPPWFHKQIELAMQINIPTLKPMQSPFLSASHARVMTTWANPHFSKRKEM